MFTPKFLPTHFTQIVSVTCKHNKKFLPVWKEKWKRNKKSVMRKSTIFDSSDHMLLFTRSLTEYWWCIVVCCTGLTAYWVVSRPTLAWRAGMTMTGSTVWTTCTLPSFSSSSPSSLAPSSTWGNPFTAGVLRSLRKARYLLTHVSLMEKTHQSRELS